MQRSRGERVGLFRPTERNALWLCGRGVKLNQGGLCESYEGVQLFSKMMASYERVLSRDTVRCAFDRFLPVASRGMEEVRGSGRRR